MIAAAIGVTPVSTEGQAFCEAGTPVCTRIETSKVKPEKVKAEKVKSDKSGSDKSGSGNEGGRRNLSHSSGSGSSSGSDSESSCKSNCVIFDCGDAEISEPACFDICAAQDFTLNLEGLETKRQARLERFDARIDLIQDPAK